MLKSASTVFAAQIVGGRDVLYNKMSIVERCISRINEVYDDNPKNLMDYTRQDSIVLNIQRAIEALIDIAMHVVSEKKLGIDMEVSKGVHGGSGYAGCNVISWHGYGIMLI